MEHVRRLGTTVVLLVLAVAGLALAAPASAHAQFLSSDPETGTTLPDLPASVVLTYSEDIAPQFVDTAVIPPGGGDPVRTDAVADGVDVTVDVSSAVDGPAAAGQWQVVARVVSADGHPVEHTVTLEVEPAAVEPDPAPSAEDAAPTATSEPEPAPATSAVAEPSVVASPVAPDPVAAVTDALPGWSGVVLAVLLIGAGAAAVVVQLRRRQPPQD